MFLETFLACFRQFYFLTQAEYFAWAIANLVPRAFSLTMFKMAARREKALAKADKISKNLGDFYHVTF